MTNVQKIIILAGVLLLSIVSFSICLWLFNQQASQYNNSKVSSNQQDRLSGETYSTGGLYNYKEFNPYGSYFVGFDAISNSGITSSDMAYINDVLINFTMYHENIFNGKISFIKDSLVKNPPSDDGTESYIFKFGINDSRVHTVKVRSNWLRNTISISIYNTTNSKVFSKSFTMYAP